MVVVPFETPCNAVHNIGSNRVHAGHQATGRRGIDGTTGDQRLDERHGDKGVARDNRKGMGAKFPAIFQKQVSPLQIGTGLRKARIQLVCLIRKVLEFTMPGRETDVGMANAGELQDRPCLQPQAVLPFSANPKSMLESAISNSNLSWRSRWSRSMASCWVTIASATLSAKPSGNSELRLRAHIDVGPAAKINQKRFGREPAITPYRNEPRTRSGP